LSLDTWLRQPKDIFPWRNPSARRCIDYEGERRMIPSHKSEIAQLMWSIEKSCEAMQRIMTDPGFSASHRAISRRYHLLGQLEERLAQHIGAEKATNAMYDIYNRVMSRPLTNPPLQS
jgi:flagellin-specific chaperone FliS